MQPGEPETEEPEGEGEYPEEPEDGVYPEEPVYAAKDDASEPEASDGCQDKHEVSCKQENTITFIFFYA